MNKRNAIVVLKCANFRFLLWMCYSNWLHKSVFAHFLYWHSISLHRFVHSSSIWAACMTCQTYLYCAHWFHLNSIAFAPLLAPVIYRVYRFCVCASCSRNSHGSKKQTSENFFPFSFDLSPVHCRPLSLFLTPLKRSGTEMKLAFSNDCTFFFV